MEYDIIILIQVYNQLHNCIIYYNYSRSNKMYKPETSFEEFLKSEQEKYPELNLKDIEALKERLKENNDLPPIRGTVLWKIPIGKTLNTCYARYRFQ